MTHSHPTGTAGSRISAADLFTDLQRGIREAQTVAQLEAVARRLDTPEFEALPPKVREETAAHYAHRLYMLTGGLVG